MGGWLAPSQLHAADYSNWAKFVYQKHSESMSGDSLCGEVNGGARGHGLTAGEATLAMGNDGGVAGNHADIVRRDPELLGANLGKRRLDPLTHGHRAGQDGPAS